MKATTNSNVSMRRTKNGMRFYSKELSYEEIWQVARDEGYTLLLGNTYTSSGTHIIIAEKPELMSLTDLRRKYILQPAEERVKFRG